MLILIVTDGYLLNEILSLSRSDIQIHGGIFLHN